LLGIHPNLIKKDRLGRGRQIGPVKFDDGTVDKKEEPRQVIGEAGDLKPTDGRGCGGAREELGREPDQLLTSPNCDRSRVGHFGNGLAICTVSGKGDDSILSGRIDNGQAGKGGRVEVQAGKIQSALGRNERATQQSHRQHNQAGEGISRNDAKDEINFHSLTHFHSIKTSIIMTRASTMVESLSVVAIVPIAHLGCNNLIGSNSSRSYSIS
jgi:hypothetical protein